MKLTRTQEYQRKYYQEHKAAARKYRRASAARARINWARALKLIAAYQEKEPS